MHPCLELFAQAGAGLGVHLELGKLVAEAWVWGSRELGGQEEERRRRFGPGPAEGELSPQPGAGRAFTSWECHPRLGQWGEVGFLQALHPKSWLLIEQGLCESTLHSVTPSGYPK